MALDESAFRKRHRYHTIFSDPEQGITFDLAAGRAMGSALEGFVRMSDQVRERIETVVIDCHWPYRQAIEQLLPHVRIVADKFHVVRVIDAAAQRVRVRNARKRRPRGRDGGRARQQNRRFNQLLWASRWTFMKRAHKLTDRDRQALLAVFDTAPEVGVAWILKEDFAAIYEASDRREGERRLDAWIEDVESSGLRELKDAWRTLQWWRDQILNHLDDPVTNAFAEGITNKIKVMKRRSYGFRNDKRYRQKVLLACGRRGTGRSSAHRIS